MAITRLYSFPNVSVMDEDEPLPGTSKQIENCSETSCTRTNSNHYKDDKTTVSGTSFSNNSYSENSLIQMGNDRLRTQIASKQRKTRERRKKRLRTTGRATKRSRRSFEPKKILRRSKRLKERRRDKRLSIAHSISTVLTNCSGNSALDGCPYCGHQCCNRGYSSYDMYSRHQKRRDDSLKYNYGIRKLKCMGTQTRILGKMEQLGVQAGSRCLMLSPLCVDTSAPPPDPPEVDKDLIGASKITPEMIIQSLRKLTMLRQEVGTAAIASYLKCNFPVDHGPRLIDELTGKLKIASIAGLVKEMRPDKWALTGSLMRRRISRTHVTLFWKLYRNALKPVLRKPAETSRDYDFEDLI